MNKRTAALVIIFTLLISALITVFCRVDAEGGERYSWEFDDSSFEIEVDVGHFGDYPQDGRIPEISSEGYGRNIIHFVDDDYSRPVANALSESLMDAYGRTYKAKAEGQRFAGFVLSFVQSNFAYAADLDRCGFPDYISISAETIRDGKGDCEDFSILYSTLMIHCGFDAGLMIYENHVVSAVALADFSPIDTEYVLAVKQQGGKAYYCCETTPGPFIPVGYTERTYSHEEGILYPKNVTG